MYEKEEKAGQALLQEQTAAARPGLLQEKFWGRRKKSCRHFVICIVGAKLQAGRSNQINIQHC
jgi:hypothetical protein